MPTRHPTKEEMNFHEYERGVDNTWNKSLDWKESLLNAALGLGEAGEVQNLIKKKMFHHKLVTGEEIIDELGDLLYYIAKVSHLLGVSLNTIMQMNHEKLKKRYPKGFVDGH